MRVLIVDDEPSQRKILATFLHKEGLETVCVQNAEEALSVLQANQISVDGEPFDAVITDLNMPGMNGLELLGVITSQYADLPVIVLTAYGSVDTAVAALKSGAFDFLTKPYEREEIVLVLQKALKGKSGYRFMGGLDKDAAGLRQLIGSSNCLKQVTDIVTKVAQMPSTVLITGESGTGKEMVAKAIHELSNRCSKPFIRINCGAIPASLMEAELFGYEKGAFTGAVSSKPGRFELADGGTLLLDEIGELPLELQVKLLRFIQESSFERVGGIRTINVDVRLIAATNINLQQAISQGKFREDLYYRLNVVPIHLPPLRDRQDDIPELARHFLKKMNLRLSRNATAFSPSAVEILQSYPWPGNVRELENIVERTLLFASKDIIEAGDLPPDIVTKTRTEGVLSFKSRVKQVTADVERGLIEQALEESSQNVTKAAQTLKISRKGLQLKMKELGLSKESQVEQNISL